MSLFALIAALLLEQLKPLQKYLAGWLTAYVDYFQHRFNSGEYRHGKAAWWLSVLPVTVAAVLVFRGLHSLHPILAWVFNVAMLYLCMGFRPFVRCATDIQLSLRSGQIDVARECLSKWRGMPSAGLGEQELARIAIEAFLIASLHHLFGVIVWYVLFSLTGVGGAAGALLYCLAQALGEHQITEFNADESAEEKTDGFAKKMSRRADWLPIRLTAATFAIVGNFEDTVYCWRSQAASWPDKEAGILLASAAGASGIRLGAVTSVDGARPDELGVGDKAGEAALHCAIRLVWRSVVFMLVILFMLTLAGLLG
ncbi:MAG: CobD/CbiB family protein [Gallionella sp.]|nr:CobD/CbiB family protein [Gallionella sp.]